MTLRPLQQLPVARRDCFANGVSTVLKAARVAGLLFGLSAAATPVLADIDMRPELVVFGPDQDVPFDNITGLAVNRGYTETAVAETGLGRVLFFDRAGYVLGQFRHMVSDAGGRKFVGRPVWLAYDHEDNLLVTDQAVPYVDVVDYRGKTIARIDLPAPDDAITGGHGAGPIAVAPDGSILVASRGDSTSVYRIDANYELQSLWDVSLDDPAELRYVTGVGIGPDGQVAIACARTKTGIKIFDATGKFIKAWGVHDIGTGNVSVPGGVVVTSDGRIWVADEVRQVVQVFDPAGNLLGVVGGEGSGPGEFEYPRALASDGVERLVVGESVGRRYQVMRIR